MRNLRAAVAPAPLKEFDFEDAGLRTALLGCGSGRQLSRVHAALQRRCKRGSRRSRNGADLNDEMSVHVVAVVVPTTFSIDLYRQQIRHSVASACLQGCSDMAFIAQSLGKIAQMHERMQVEKLVPNDDEQRCLRAWLDVALEEVRLLDVPQYRQFCRPGTSPATARLGLLNLHETDTHAGLDGPLLKLGHYDKTIACILNAMSSVRPIESSFRQHTSSARESKVQLGLRPLRLQPLSE